MKFLLAVAFTALASTSVYAAGDAAAGKAKSATCQACHGGNGVSTGPTFPNLAGQKEAYLVAQLQAFKSGDRQGGQSALMTPMVLSLSDQDMKDLAAFFSSLPAAK